MVAGDVVAGISAAATTLLFQAAVGVECIILSASVYNGWVRTTNGVLYTNYYNMVTSTGGTYISPNVKIAINNTIYLRLEASISAGETGGYSGIQTK